MAYELEMPNGEVVTVNDNSTQPQDAYDEWKRQVYAEHNADPNMVANPDRTYHDKMVDILNAQNKEGHRPFATFTQGAAGEGALVGKQIGNILGLVPDEEVKQAKADIAPVSDAEGGAVGRFAGDTIALAPLGAIGSGARALSGINALRALGSPLVTGALEGAAGGSILAGPGQRAQGAQVGALTGGALGALRRIGNKFGREGPLPQDPEAASYRADLEKAGVNEPFIPASQMSKSTAPAFIQAIIGAFPKSAAKYSAQDEAAINNLQEVALRKAYPQVVDDVLKEFKANGFKSAINLGTTLMQSVKTPAKNLSAPSREFVAAMASKRRDADVNPDVMAQTIRNARPMGTPANTQLLGITQKAENVLGSGRLRSTPIIRRATLKVGSWIKGEAGIPILNQLSTMFATKGFQNWLTGSTKGQRALQELYASDGGQDALRAMDALQRAYASETAQ